MTALPLPSSRLAAWGDSLTGRFLLALFAAYDDEAVRYVALRNYERWPEDFGKDVDLVVHPNDLQRSHVIVGRLADELGLQWIVRRKRSGHLTYHLLARRPAEGDRGVLLDLRPNLVHRGVVYLPGPLVLESRQRRGAFYVPSAALESLGMILHCVLDARDVRPSYRARLGELGVGDRAEFLEAATEVLGPAVARRLAATMAGGDPMHALALRRALLLACVLRDLTGARRWLVVRGGAVWDRLCAWLRPPGQLVVLVGPDGAGKTTHSELICRRFAATRVPVSTVYLGAQKPLLFTRRLSQKIRRRLTPPGTVKPPKDVNRRTRLRGLVHILADKWLRYVVHVRPHLVRGEIVVLDRYFYDLRTYPHPLVRRRWIEALVMRCIPEPAVTFSLSADPALITARKHELTVAETARQLECYRGLRRWARNFHEVPADGDLPQVVAAMAAEVLRVYAHDRTPEQV